MRGRGDRPDGEALPIELEDAFGATDGVRELFDAMPPAHRREYVAWICEARREDARRRRAAQTVMRLLSGVSGS